jgi:starch phosphorylase
MKSNGLRFPNLPHRLKNLGDLALNLWFSWHSDAVRLFESLDPHLWQILNENPVRMLREVDVQRLQDVSENPDYLAEYDRVIKAFNNYMKNMNTWFAQHYPEFIEKTVAYFSMEFGIHECLPVYSGGLGMLAGDHLKSSSDLGIPLVAMGILYRESYFTQQIASNGFQQSQYVRNDFDRLPVHLVRSGENEPVTVRVEVDSREIGVRIWRAQVGRVPLYLLDTDYHENSPEDRKITERLYVGDRDYRLMQEMVLGMGGVRVLKALGITPAVWHLNEGHCSLLVAERMRDKLRKDGNVVDALDKVRSSTVFTTHTPVAAGNEVFERSRIEAHLKAFWEAMKITGQEFMSLGQNRWNPDSNSFNMTILALKSSVQSNAVSKLHREVSQKMWSDLWPELPPDRIPISSITNGIHVRTWMAMEMKRLLDRHIGADWRYHQNEPGYWKEKIDSIPDKDLWITHEHLRQLLRRDVRLRIQTQQERNGETPEIIASTSRLLEQDALTIGFARRFAQYKRGTLLFRDRERLKRLVNNPDRPVQIVFAGKAHPADQPGKALIQHIYQESRNPDFQNRIVFVENYDMGLARNLVAGVDVWLNTPRRPMEASGTSGMKAACNGAINLSVLDGWWRECYNGENGWAIGEDREYYNEWEQDEADYQSLFRILEEQVVPMYYDRPDSKLPCRWIERMKASMKTIIPQFNTHRMIEEYMGNLYLPVLKKKTRKKAAE